MSIELKPTYGTGKPLASDPVIWVIDDFVTAAECAHVIRLARDRLGEAQVSRVGENSPDQTRTGRTAWIWHHESPMISALVARVSELVGIPSSHAEPLQVVHYGVEQQYQPHFDGWDVATPTGHEHTKMGGNRAVTALMYLSDVDGGGATSFPTLGLEVDAVPGRLCIFHGITDGGRLPHPDSLHGGMPVSAGEKWACNLWFRERPYV